MYSDLKNLTNKFPCQLRAFHVQVDVLGTSDEGEETDVFKDLQAWKEAEKKSINHNTVQGAQWVGQST